MARSSKGGKGGKGVKANIGEKRVRKGIGEVVKTSQGWKVVGTAKRPAAPLTGKKVSSRAQSTQEKAKDFSGRNTLPRGAKSPASFTNKEIQVGQRSAEHYGKMVKKVGPEALDKMINTNKWDKYSKIDSRQPSSVEKALRRHNEKIQKQKEAGSLNKGSVKQKLATLEGMKSTVKSGGIKSLSATIQSVKNDLSRNGYRVGQEKKNSANVYKISNPLSSGTKPTPMAKSNTPAAKGVIDHATGKSVKENKAGKSELNSYGYKSMVEYGRAKKFGPNVMKELAAIDKYNAGPGSASMVKDQFGRTLKSTAGRDKKAFVSQARYSRGQLSNPNDIKRYDKMAADYIRANFPVIKKK